MINTLLIKHGSPKPGVAGSSPVTPAIFVSKVNDLTVLPKVGKNLCVTQISQISQSDVTHNVTQTERQLNDL